MERAPIRGNISGKSFLVPLTRERSEGPERLRKSRKSCRSIGQFSMAKALRKSVEDRGREGAFCQRPICYM